MHHVDGIKRRPTKTRATIIKDEAMRKKILGTCDIDFKVKALEDGSVYLSGWANKAVVDRGKDLIPKKAWNLKNFKKNAIMLFNHDHSKPIGKFLVCEAKDEGLYVEGRIAKSKDPEISRIRDLVQEGILNSLSVGIMVSDEEQKDGINHVKSAELHEISVVAVPMNQDSTFTVSTKSMDGTLLDTMELISTEVGFQDVARACQKIRAKSADCGSIDSMADQLVSETGIEKEKALGFLRMHGETPEQIRGWIDKSAETEEEKAELEEGQEVQAIMVPKEALATIEEVQAWAEASGWSSSEVVEGESAWVLVQKPSDQFGELVSVDMGDGVTALVGTPVPAETEEVQDEKGLLDNADPMTQPISGNTAANVEVNPTLDQMKQTNVLLATAVQLLQRLVEKVDTMGELKTPEIEVEVETEANELEKTLSKFMKKTTERLSSLGL